MKPPNSLRPRRICSSGASFAITANTSETKNANSTSSPKWLISLAANAHVVGVEHDQHVQQPGDDQERVAVLVRRRRHHTLTEMERRRDEVRDTHAEVGERRESHERIRELKRGEPAIEPEADREHDRQRDEEDHAFLAAADDEVTCPRYQP